MAFLFRRVTVPLEPELWRTAFLACSPLVRGSRKKLGGQLAQRVAIQSCGAWKAVDHRSPAIQAGLVTAFQSQEGECKGQRVTAWATR